MAIQFDNTNTGTLTLRPGASGSYALVFPAAVAAVNGYVLSSDTSGNLSWVAAGGAGTVTAVSVASANGFAGSSSGGATPALTITTSITGVLRGNGTAISAATAGTDYLAPPAGTAILKANSGGALANATAGTDYLAPAGTFNLGTTSITFNRASATQSLTGINIDGSAGSATTAGTASVGTTVTTTASTTNSAFKIPMLNTTGVATGNFGLLLDSSVAGDFTYNPSTNTLTVGVAEVTSPTPATVNAIRARSNIAWQSPSATSTITSKMLDAGTLSFEGTVGQLFSITNSMTGTIFSVNDISGIPSIEVLDTGVIKMAQYAGFVAYGVSSALTATGNSQGTALAVTRPINDVTTVAASTGVVFPAATPGMRIVIRNGGSNTLNVYPASGAQINALGTNVAFPIVVATVLEFIALSTTQWYTLNVTYA